MRSISVDSDWSPIHWGINCDKIARDTGQESERERGKKFTEGGGEEVEIVNQRIIYFGQNILPASIEFLLGFRPQSH